MAKVLNERYFRYCSWKEMNETLAKQGREPHSSDASEIYLIEITKEEYDKITK